MNPPRTSADEQFFPTNAALRQLKEQVARGARRFWRRRGLPPPEDYRELRAQSIRTAIARRDYKRRTGQTPAPRAPEPETAPDLSEYLPPLEP